jgi:hypothetical protein
MVASDAASTDPDDDVDTYQEKDDYHIPYCYWLCGHKAEVIVSFSTDMIGGGTIDVPLCKRCYHIWDPDRMFKCRAI